MKSSKGMRSALVVLASVAVMILINAVPAFADNSSSQGDPSQPGSSLQQGPAPRESYPNIAYQFNFTDNDRNTSYPPNGHGIKQDNSSFWIECDSFNVDYCNLYADALHNGSYVNCTTPGHGVLQGTGQFELYNKVFEWYGAGTYTRLGGYRAQTGQGWVTGWWTPDCQGHFQVI